MDEINLNNLTEKADFIREICLKLNLTDDVASDVITFIRSFFLCRENSAQNSHRIKNVSNIVKNKKKINKRL